MKVNFLGTIAAEGGPALFCNCRYCQEAARRGGKDIRTRSQILVNEDLLVDFPADTYLHKLRHGLDLSKVRYLLITHSHRDHFYPEDIFNRGAQSAHDMVEPTLDIYCNQATKDLFDVRAVGNLQRAVAEGLKWNVLSEFEHVQTERYEFWALKAQHMKTENARCRLTAPLSLPDITASPSIISRGLSKRRENFEKSKKNYCKKKENLL